jgi:hypothetical protein
MISKPIDGVGARKKFLVYVVIVVITGGSLFDIITGKEHWPFSPYPMFSSVKRDYFLTKLQLFGVTESGSPQEISLSKSKFIQPLDNSRLSAALNRELQGEIRKQNINKILHALWSRYEVLRHEGRHNGPPLRGIRLYQSHWKLDPHARNINQPDRRELIFEIMGSINK